MDDAELTDALARQFAECRELDLPIPDLPLDTPAGRRMAYGWLEKRIYERQRHCPGKGDHGL